jgi:hypothetical protein
MWQLMTAPDATFPALQQRATDACVVFLQQPLPPGATPARARVGIEVVRETGATKLLVDRGIRYDGPNADVRQWLSEGRRDFASFTDLRRWLQQDLRACYENSGVLTPADLTDLAAVRRQGTAGSDHPTVVDEEDLIRRLGARIRGQDDAIRAMAKQLGRHIVRCAPRRPASLMAVGPTGVGKTASAEAAAAILAHHGGSGAGYGYLRIDMNEYQERHRIAQLLGAPQGYVGYGEASQLIQALRRDPRTLVLFDEIDKAHPDLFRSLMNAVDAGRLSSPSASNGSYTVDCRHAVFLFTSNSQAYGILEDLEQRQVFANRATVDAVCRKHLQLAGVAPELLGRIGGFLVFRPLKDAVRAEIVTLAIARVAEEYGVRIAHIDPTVVSTILCTSSDRQFGARPDEFIIDDMLGSCFAQARAQGHRLVRLDAGPPARCMPVNV